jgi:hypothetical protein
VLELLALGLDRVQQVLPQFIGDAALDEVLFEADASDVSFSWLLDSICIT